MLKELFKKANRRIHEKVYSYRTVRKEPSEWVEENIYLTSAESRYTGLMKYDITPYTREIINCLSPMSDVEVAAVMKNNQSGATASVIIPAICYSISEAPCNMMFISATEDLAKDTVRDKLDPVIQNSGLTHLIRSSDTRKRNQRTGNTDFKKEFAGGTLNVGSYKPSNFRMHSVKVILADEFDNAPRNDKDEGSIRKILENRTTAYGSTKKIFYISTPTVKGKSNIEDIYELGDKRKWHWKCPHCSEYISVEWRVDKGDNLYAGVKWELDDKQKLIPESIHYECQNCGGKISESLKYDLNLSGKWIATAIPEREEVRSYSLNAVFLPPGYDSWLRLAKDWLEACPPNDSIDEGKLKAFVNTKLGQTWEEKGTAPRVNELMSNTRTYDVGTVPDKTCEQDGNGKIILITMAVDLGGVMEVDYEDVRIDWEIIAHTSTGATYHINHGSIGTFKRTRKKTSAERKNESERDMYTYAHGMRFSVWPYLKAIIEKPMQSQGGDLYTVEMTAIDTGHFTKLAYDFIKAEENPFIIGVKGYGIEEYRKLSADTPTIKRSQEMFGKLYILQVNQLKDILASNMKLKKGMDGYQPSGFMNFPQPSEGKYNYKGYFTHYEGEHRIEDENKGFVWKKKNSNVENHFFDVSVYNLAAKEIYIDILRRSHTQNSRLTWEDYVLLVENNSL